MPASRTSTDTNTAPNNGAAATNRPARTPRQEDVCALVQAFPPGMNS